MSGGLPNALPHAVLKPATPAVPVGDVRFSEACLPPLEDGKYEVTAEQIVTVPKSSSFPSANVTFYVKGPRFTLKPSDIFSQHPTPGQVGLFANDLPHVVLTRKTLPWERSIDGTAVGPAKSADDPVPPPWLAIFLVDSKDPSYPPSTDPQDAGPLVQSGTVNNLLSPPSGVLGPDIALDPWEQNTDVCRYIDIPAALYRQLVPSLADMQLLCHVREINTGDTVIDDIKADGSYSVVVGNRLPYSEQPAKKDLGIRNTACLVSLEGFGEYLSGGKPLPTETKAVRLAVLTSWSFFDDGGDDLQILLEKLNAGPLSRTARPIKKPKNRPMPGDPQYVDYAFGQGFAGLNHQMRTGDQTVSWYRGPLQPFMTVDTAWPTFASSDAALRYDPKSGMFDVSYAAAWQLGRLLALQSRQVATALHNYDSTTADRARRRAALAALRDSSGALAGATVDELERSLQPRLLRWMAASDIATRLPENPKRSPPEGLARPPAASSSEAPSLEPGGQRWRPARGARGYREFPGRHVPARGRATALPRSGRRHAAERVLSLLQSQRSLAGAPDRRRTQRDEIRGPGSARRHHGRGVHRDRQGRGA